MNEYERVKKEALLTDEEIANILKQAIAELKQNIIDEEEDTQILARAYRNIAQAAVEKVLKDPRVEIRADDQRLLDSPYAKMAERTTGYYCSQQDMLKPDSEGKHWIRVIQKEEK